MMSASERRFDSILFNYETTGKTDFRGGKIEPPIHTIYKPKQSCLRIRPPPLKNLNSLTEWKNPTVPFYLMVKPKDIVQTNPWTVQKPHSEPEDLMRAEVQRTRPSLIISPAINLDAFDDSIRKRMLEEVYSTTASRMSIANCACASRRRACAPLPEHVAPANPIVLKRLVPAEVSPEWRMDSVCWDHRQLRTYCSPTKDFWLARNPKCDVCAATMARNAQRKMSMKIQ